MNNKFLESYLARSRKAWQSNNLKFKHVGYFSLRAVDNLFDCTVTLVQETKKFCKDNGFSIDRISVVFTYDADLDLSSSSIRSDSDTILRVVELEDGRLEATLFVGSFVETRVGLR